MGTYCPRSPRFRGRRLLAALLALVATQATATRINSDLCVNAPEPDERRQHHSAVYDAFGARVAYDFEYARQLRGGPAAPKRPGARGLAVDVVMQQCFGGGFLNDVQSSGIRQQTFASAASWREVAWFDYTRTPRGIDDLTRAWRRDADTTPFGGMLGHFRTALCGRPLPPAVQIIARDIYAPGGPKAGRRPEHPQYASPDAAAGGGANDLRELGGVLQEDRNGHPANAADRQFAILVAWSQPEDADRLEIARVFKTLTQTHNVARSHIAVLYPRACSCAADADCTTRARTKGQCTNGTCTDGTSRRVACTGNPDCAGGHTCQLPALGPYDAATPDDAGPNAFAAIDVQATNSEADWLKALDGDFFRTAAGAVVVPQRGDQLLIYNTGHGSHLKRLPRKERHLPFDDDGDGLATDLRVQVSLTDGFNVSLEDEALPVVTDDDATDLIQLSLRRSADDAHLRVNGVLLPEPLGVFRTSPAEAIAVEPFVTGSTVTYQVRVDHALLAEDPDTATLDLLGLGGTVDRNVVAAVVFGGGRQQYVAVLSACSFDTNGDGVPDLTLDDADDDGLCEWPQGSRAFAGTLTFGPENPVEFTGVTSVTARRIVVEEGAVLAGQAPGLGRLTLTAKGMATSDIVSRGTIDIAASDDVTLQATGTVDLGGPTAIAAGDRVDVKATQGNILVMPPPTGPDVGFTLFGRNRVTLSARSAGGVLDVAAARIGGFRIILDTRANVSVVGAKQLLVRDGTLLTTDRARTGLPNASNIQLNATGRIGVSDAVIDAGTHVSIATQRVGDDLCLSNGATLEAADGTGNLYLTGVHGTVHADASVSFIGRILGHGIVDAPCP